MAETWERSIGGRRLVSRQVRAGEVGWEPHGPLVIRTRTVATPTEVTVVQDGTTLRLGRWDVPFPGAFAPKVSARAWIDPQDQAPRPPRFHIEVRVSVPLVGTLLSYQGHICELRPDGT
ncbi:DUF4166 domain-containing protein [Sphaerisporangium corydalis]|uniref:DUF4166 domain-containing protein n=1 Tax=Sphaerisporangium corydalis TaxID=1441875 RepID=UPI0021D233A8|nr:DUF4166 domain-containing protein [Sphaerisporangium corydalis]